jgi:3D (Asp-Asp-Asp) domain-containing protein
MRIAILRAYPVSIQGLDLNLTAKTRAATVADLLAERQVTLGPLDRVEPPPAAPVPAGGMVRVVRVAEETGTELVPVPYRTVTQSAPALPAGARVRVRAGMPGLVERSVQRTLEDGQEVQRAVLAEHVLRQPIDEVIALGSRAVLAPAPTLPGGAPGGVTLAPPALAGGPPNGEGVRRVLTMDATAYDPGPIRTGKRPGDPGYGITASGMRAAYGVVAVDPRVIPMFTRLYIPGYGYAVAGDTGGAIRGHRIDLFFPTYGEALRFGRRGITVYVLE